MPQPRSFDYEPIWLKAVAFTNRALDVTDDFEERAFWAACALELLGKSALTKVSPALIADIKGENVQSLLIATGLHQDAAKFVSVQAKTVFTRCQSLTKEFDASKAIRIAGNRNGYVHSGAPFCIEIPPERWWEQYWPLVSILLAEQDKELKDLVGADRVREINVILANSKQHADQRTQALLDRAQLVYQRLQRDELSATETAAIQARVSGHFSYVSTHSCPACGSEGSLRGGTTLETEDIFEYDEDDNFIYTVREIATDEFGCRTCGLLLRGPDAVSYAGLPTSFEFREEGPDDYEPDYGND